MGCTFGKPEEVRPLGLQKRRLTQLVGESAAGTFTTVKTAPFVFVSEARLPAAAGDAAALEVRFAGKTVPGRDATHLVKQNQDQCFAITDFAEVRAEGRDVTPSGGGWGVTNETVWGAGEPRPGLLRSGVHSRACCRAHL